MAAITNQAEQKTGIWQGIVSLKPLKKHFEWWVRLIAITVIPIVIICTVVIGMELTTPDLFKKGIGYVVAVLAENALNLGVEASMFGCIILAKDAKKQGSTKQYATMLNTGIFFALLTITTVAFKLFQVSDTLNQVLLIFRDASVIGYVFLSHLQEDDEENRLLNPEQVATLETRLSEQVGQITATMSATSSQLVANVKQQVSMQVAHEVANMQTVISTQVANDTRLSEQIEALMLLVTEQACTIQNLTSSFAEVRREVRTTVTEIRSISHEAPTVPQIAAHIIDAPSEPGERVRSFLNNWQGSSRPTIQAIMDACQVAKRTATIHRDKFYGTATSSQSEED